MPRGVPNKKPDVAGPVDETQLKREILFMQALREVLITLRLHSDEQLRRKIGPERLTDITLEFFAFMEAGSEELRQDEKLALSIQLLRCLSKYIVNVMKLPVTLKTMADCMGLIETAVDNAFPGYWGSKLLKYTILPVRVAV